MDADPLREAGPTSRFKCPIKVSASAKTVRCLSEEDLQAKAGDHSAGGSVDSADDVKTIEIIARCRPDPIGSYEHRWRSAHILFGLIDSIHWKVCRNDCDTNAREVTHPIRHCIAHSDNSIKAPYCPASQHGYTRHATP
jgi:hypothetical protein